MELQYTEKYLLEELRQIANSAGQKQVARQYKVSPQFLCDVLKRRRGISAQLAKAMGYNRVVHFERRAK